jgi:hypothetical protein
MEGYEEEYDDDEDMDEKDTVEELHWFDTIREEDVDLVNVHIELIQTR